MTASTKQVLISILSSDPTVAKPAIEHAMMVLEGKGVAKAGQYTKLISKSQAARILGCSRQTLYDSLDEDAKRPNPRLPLVPGLRKGLYLREADVMAVSRGEISLPGLRTGVANEK